MFCLSNVIILFEYVSGILYKYLFGRIEYVVFEVIERDIAIGWFIDPIEIVFEVIRNFFDDIEFINRECISDIHGNLG